MVIFPVVNLAISYYNGYNNQKAGFILFTEQKCLFYGGENYANANGFPLVR